MDYGQKVILAKEICKNEYEMNKLCQGLYDNIHFFSTIKTIVNNRMEEYRNSFTNNKNELLNALSVYHKVTMNYYPFPNIDTPAQAVFHVCRISGDKYSDLEKDIELIFKEALKHQIQIFEKDFD